MASLALIGALGSTAGTLGTAATVASAVAGVASAGSAIAGVQAAKEQATEQNAQYRYQKKVQEQEANASRASGQRAASARYREGREIASRQQAIAAASGGGGDQSVVNIMNQTADETDLAARTEMFNAENRALGFENQATVSGINASNALSSGTLGAFGATLGGVSSMYDRFGRTNKQTTTTAGRYG